MKRFALLLLLPVVASAALPPPGTDWNTLPLPSPSNPSCRPSAANDMYSKPQATSICSITVILKP